MNNSRTPLIVQTLRGQETDRPPVWLMRQAGRYMSEYRALKEKYSFLELCKIPELALEVSLQPINAFDMDAAIVFSDILLPVEALGFEIDFNPGPIINNALTNPREISSLTRGNLTKVVSSPLQTISQLKRELSKPENPKGVLGFVGAPWTLACYLLEQKPFKHYERSAIHCRRDPEGMHLLLSEITSCIKEYAAEQVASKADAVQIFDTWGGTLAIDDYRRFALPYIQEIVAAIRAAGGLSILYVNGSNHLLPAMVESGADAISVDWRTELATLKELKGVKAVQGNVDPSHLFDTSSELRNLTTQLVRSWGKRSGLIVNLGHGVLQHTPRENVELFVDTVKQFKWDR